MSKLSKRLMASLLVRTEADNIEQYDQRKRVLFADLAGTILEIGPGAGVNLRYVPADCRWIGIEPNERLHPHLRARADQFGIDADIRTGMSEDTDVPHASVDVVISTLVMCSVADVDQTLAETVRVLRPGGRFLFIEHVVDTINPFRRAVQKTVPYTPWRLFSDGCNPGRDLAGAIERAGFADVDIERYMHARPGIIPMVIRPHIVGVATKAIN